MKKIFIIEDDKNIREELSTFLSKYGYVCEAPCAFDNIIKDALSGNNDLVLLDINLPVFDGYYICREIRKQSDIPIIVVTSRDTELDELMAMNLGADDFITKPYNTQILLAHISSVLKRSLKETVSDRMDCRDFCINLSCQKSAILHRPEIGGKHFLRDNAKGPFQFAETPCPVHEIPKDQNLPFIAHQPQSNFDGTGGHIIQHDLFPFHTLNLFNSIRSHTTALLSAYFTNYPYSFIVFLRATKSKPDSIVLGVKK
jgi:CheY-like chemotaxis protein